MKYTVYTDGSYSEVKKKSGCAYLIISPTHYIKSDLITVDKLSNNIEAETVAPSLAAIYLIDNVDLKPDDIVEFNVDCASTIIFYNKLLKESGRVPASNEFIRYAGTVIRELASICRVDFVKVKGHKTNINPNTFVDRLAKIAVRRD